MKRMISIVIPARNEEARIGKTLERYLAHFQAEAEIIVVTNNTSDNTVAVVESYIASHPQLRVIDIPEAIGKGGAIIEGFRAATGDVVGFVDADGATPPQSFHELALACAESTDLAIAGRRLPESTIVVPQTLRRRLISRVFNLLVRLLLRLPFRDTQCGAKAMRHSVARQLIQDVHCTGWAFDVDLLICAQKRGYSIRECPTVWEDQPGSTLAVAGASFNMFLDLLKLRAYHRSELPPLKDTSMTTYLYETIPAKKGSKPKRYEIEQSMSEDALTHHPETGEPIKRIITGGFGYMKSKDAGGGGGSFDDHGHDHDHPHHDHDH